MTDKELKKLSRLELLELLLKESKEKEKMKAELEKLRAEKGLISTAKYLQDTASQIDSSLQNANALTDALKKIVSAEGLKSITQAADTCSSAPKKASVPDTKSSGESTDSRLYKRLLLFFSRNSQALSHLPQELQEDIVKRLTEITKK